MNAYVLLISLLVLCLAILATAKDPVKRPGPPDSKDRTRLERNNPH